MAKTDEVKELVEKEIIKLKYKKETNVVKRLDETIKLLETIRDELGTPDKKFDLTVSVGAKTTVGLSCNGSAIGPGKNVLKEGDVLEVTATPYAGYRLTKFTINGVNAQSGDTVVVSSDVSIVTEATQAFDLAVSASHATVSVTADGESVSAGEEVLLIGQKLKVTATPAEDYELTTLTLNGTAIESGAEITVSADVSIVAEGTIPPQEESQE